MSGIEKCVLENEQLLIEVDTFGAELARIYDKKKNREVLWDAKPEIWKRHAPILFPFVGNCFEKAYSYQGVEYEMASHGFARDMDFEQVSAGADEVWYQLCDSEETYGKYPFHFKLEVGHKLEGNTIRVMWKVANTGDGPMYFMIGGHPAFNTPPGHGIYDFTLKFETEGGKESLDYEAPNSAGYVAASLQDTLVLRDGQAAVEPGFFHKALTYIFHENQVKAVSLQLPGGKPYVTMRCEGFPYLAVWSIEETHPFVCLEPWFGRCADDGFAGDLSERAGIVALEGRETFEASYTIEIH